MGAADVIPGVSGGTMAFILGIYARLLGAIRAFDLELVRTVLARRLADAAEHVDLRFLVPLGCIDQAVDVELGGDHVLCLALILRGDRIDGLGDRA